MPKGSTLYVAQSDFKDFFYGMSIHDDLVRFFSMPPVSAEVDRELGAKVDGLAVEQEMKIQYALISA